MATAPMSPSWSGQATTYSPCPQPPSSNSGESWRVFVVEAGRAVLRDVEIGERADARTQIVSGLRTGDTVVLFPSDDLVDGTRVRGAVEEGRP